jgi:hypothetical protein
VPQHPNILLHPALWALYTHTATRQDVGAEQCDDYIYLKGRVRVNTDAFARGVRLIGDRPLPHDATLYASDHIGIVADLVVD